MKWRVFPLLLLSSVLLFQIVCTEKILVVTFFESKSHKITYMGLIEELAKRGHEITIVSPVKAMKEIKNVKEIFTIDLEKGMLGSRFNVFEMKEKKTSLNPFMLVDEFGAVCRQSYDLPQVKELINQKFDLIFFQPLFNDCVLGLIHRLKAPLVLFFPTTAPTFLLSKLGGDHPPSVTPNLFLGYSDEMTFPQRFFNFGASAFMEGVLRFYYEPAMTAIYREKLGHDIPNVREILGNTSLALSNGHFSLSKPKPYLPDIIDVGGIHSKPAKPLPKDLEDYVTKSGKDGFIYFSMGSAIKGNQMPEERRKIFLNVFSKLKQQVLWKWETETMPDLPKNVKLSKWLPQQDLLGHPNIRMFITHCGGGSTEESIYHGVPLVGLPMYGDQPMNAKLAEQHGFIVPLDWNSFNEEQLSAAVNDVLNNPKYRDNVKKLSNIFRDQPDDPLKRGVYWVEYVMRHKGAPHLRSASRKLNYIQYHSWDVIGAYLVILLGTIYIIVSIIKFIARKICGSKKNTQSLKHKKNQ